MKSQIIRLPQVIEKVGLKQTTIYKNIKLSFMAASLGVEHFKINDFPVLRA